LGSPMMIQVTRAGTRWRRSETGVERVRKQFETGHCLVLRRFVEPTLLRIIQQKLTQLRFRERKYTVGGDLAITQGPLLGALQVLLNDPQLFVQIRRLTGCGQIGKFVGRVYRMIPGRGHDFVWHNDLQHNRRLVALTVNLGENPFSGGLLQIREAQSKRVLHEIANTGPGDAVLFRVGPGLQHRVTTVTGSIPKTALAGWFVSAPGFASAHEKWFPENHASAIGLEDSVAISREVVFRRLGATTILVNLMSETYFGLDEIGSRIWELLITHLRIGAAASAIAREYGVSREVVGKDVLVLVRELEAKHLIKIIRAKRNAIRSNVSSGVGKIAPRAQEASGATRSSA
jgi:coenzyme PQQ synthesis protein D (PqqD)/2-oxoglutarate-Fe(II)-dependent oxygenase superfamily protein